MLPGYADEHVHQGITAGLRLRGMDVVTAQERGQRNTDDEILLATATGEGRLMLTNDVDFLRLHNEWMTAGKTHAGIVFWPQRFPIGEAIRRIRLYATPTDAADAANTVRYL
jgi:hypothetical protein